MIIFIFANLLTFFNHLFKKKPIRLIYKPIILDQNNTISWYTIMLSHWKLRLCNEKKKKKRLLGQYDPYSNFSWDESVPDVEIKYKV